jgi:hypothetical protein
MAIERWRAGTWLLALACVVVAPASTAAGPQHSDRRGADAPRRTIAGTTVVGHVDRRTIQAALEALPRRPTSIVIVDDAVAPRAAYNARELDGFVPVGSRVIHRRRQSPTLRAAEYEGGPYVLVLATVLWHEMAHAEGADEASARRREEELWDSFMRAGRVESGAALRYKADLRQRH